MQLSDQDPHCRVLSERGGLEDFSVCSVLCVMCLSPAPAGLPGTCHASWKGDRPQ